MSRASDWNQAYASRMKYRRSDESQIAATVKLLKISRRDFERLLTRAVYVEKMREADAINTTGPKSGCSTVGQIEFLGLNKVIDLLENHQKQK